MFHCPYCHGWEAAGRRWGIVTYDRPLIARRLEWLRNWTDDLVLFVDDAFDEGADPPGAQVERRVISDLTTKGSGLAGVTVVGGDEVPLRALLWPVRQRLPALIVDLGLALDPDGHVLVDETQQTSQPGVFAAGDVSCFARQQVIDAAAGGVAAAKAVVNDLTRRWTREPSTAV